MYQAIERLLPVHHHIVSPCVRLALEDPEMLASSQLFSRARIRKSRLSVYSERTVYPSRGRGKETGATRGKEEKDASAMTMNEILAGPTGTPEEYHRTVAAFLPVVPRYWRGVDGRMIRARKLCVVVAGNIGDMLPLLFSRLSRRSGI